jgi:hypothetical protein
MLYRFRTKWAKRIFDARVSKIWRTPPIDFHPAEFTILSMVSHSDLSMYLLAVKSFYARLQSGKILIIDDGSLTADDRSALERHLCSPTIIRRDVINIGRFLSHIMWERLAYALDLSADEYVIQLDADTVTTGPVTEIADCIAENRAFTLGTYNGQRIVPASEASAYAMASSAQDHIQIISERMLARLPGAAELNYVRGSAGLVGLARNGFTRVQAEDFCVRMTDLVGRRFAEWGTDQVAINFIVANSPNPFVLPYPDYAVVGPELDAARSRFLHFIGTNRFEGGHYANHGRRFISLAAAGDR